MLAAQHASRHVSSAGSGHSRLDRPALERALAAGIAVMDSQQSAGNVMHGIQLTEPVDEALAREVISIFLETWESSGGKVPPGIIAAAIAGLCIELATRVKQTEVDIELETLAKAMTKSILGVLKAIGALDALKAQREALVNLKPSGWVM